MIRILYLSHSSSCQKYLQDATVTEVSNVKAKLSFIVLSKDGLSVKRKCVMAVLLGVMAATAE